MNGRWRSVLAASCVAAFAGIAAAQEKGAPGSEAKAAPGDEHKTGNRAELKWGPAPESLPRGAKAAVVQGDPSQAELFTVRLRMPKGYMIPPHTHPTAEYVTVVSGTLYLGEGDRATKKGVKALKAGGWALIPEGHHHFAISDAADTEVQIHGTGPFEITYINPADDPRNKKQATVK